jgi:hypothetical protein
MSLLNAEDREAQLGPLPKTGLGDLIGVGQRYHERCREILLIRQDLTQEGLYQQIRILGNDDFDACWEWSHKLLTLARDKQLMPWEVRKSTNGI